MYPATRAILCTLLTCPFLGAFTAQAGEPEWCERCPDPSPSVRSEHAMAYDSGRGRVVLFGGFAPGLDRETWEWDGHEWFHVSSSGPSARRVHCMAYDSNRGRTVLFGGLDNDGINGETWEWDSYDWERVHAGDEGAPKPGGGHAMAYDSARQVVVLFGGTNGIGTHYHQTWEWDGSEWSMRCEGDPPARASHGMAYDSHRNVVVLFGGANNTSRFGDTWEWNGEAWTQRSSDDPNDPCPRHNFGMAYDAARTVTVLFGGSPSLGDTWEWDGEVWSERDTAGPSARHHHAMAYDDARNLTVLFGGYDTYHNDETWEYGVGAPSVEHEFFDDFTYFNYTDPNDPNNPVDPDFTDFGWYVRDWQGKPGLEGADWRKDYVVWDDDPQLADNRIMRLLASTNGDAKEPNSTDQSEVGTPEKFFEGTYCACVRFTDEWRNGTPQPSVQAFFAINERAECDPTYSECDFEYLPNDNWSGECSGPALHVLSWALWSDPNTPEPDCDDVPDRIADVRCGALSQWHVYLYQVIGGEVTYCVDDCEVLVDEPHAGDFYPDQDMRILFNHWFWPDDMAPMGQVETYGMEVDWVYHAKDVALTTCQVQAIVAEYRANGVRRRDTVRGSQTSSGDSVDPGSVRPVPPP